MIQERAEGGHGLSNASTVRAALPGLVLPIALLAIVFSLDGVISAIGMVSLLQVMIAAVIIAVPIVSRAAGPVSEFVERYPADGFGVHGPKDYIHAATGFSARVDALNQIASRRLRTQGGAAQPDGGMAGYLE